MSYPSSLPLPHWRSHAGPSRGALGRGQSRGWLSRPVRGGWSRLKNCLLRAGSSASSKSRYMILLHKQLAASEQLYGAYEKRRWESAASCLAPRPRHRIHEPTDLRSRRHFPRSRPASAVLTLCSYFVLCFRSTVTQRHNPMVESPLDVLFFFIPTFLSPPLYSPLLLLSLSPTNRCALSHQPADEHAYQEETGNEKNKSRKE